MPDAVADTHGLIWYLEDSPRLGSTASAVFAACDRGEVTIYVPTICIVEIVYLQEKGRIPAEMRTALAAALQGKASGLRLANLTAEVAEAVAQIPRDTVPDMPDRIIAATALVLRVPLLSRDPALAAVKELEIVW